MATQPSEDNISQFMDVTAFDRTTAIKYLRGTNNDLWKAIDMAINGEPPNQQPQVSTDWNEGDWVADRNGDYAQGNMPSFQIDVADDIPPYSHSVAPSRPPSRNSQRSLISASNQRDNSVSGRESRMDIDQETGLIKDGTSAPYFGPATRSHYDASDWALTVSDVNTSDNKTMAPAQYRKREPDQLAFLRPSQSKDFLPLLLSILNTIPLARNALLLNSHIASDYGYDSDWWNGTSIETSSTIVVDLPSVSKLDLDIVEETQRLMAFLDLTERAYGSVEPLARLEALSKISQSASADHLSLSTDYEKFLVAWEAAALKIAPEADIKGILSSTATANELQHRFLVLAADLGRDTPFKPLTIYDVLDAKIFIEEWPAVEEEDMAVITEPAKVFILKLKQSDASCSGLGLDVPIVWYADRYLKGKLPVTKNLRQNIARSKALIQHCDEKSEELTKFDLNGKDVDPFKLLQASMKAFRPRTAEEKEVFPRTLTEESEEEKRHSEIIEELQKAFDDLRKRLDELKQEKEHTIPQLRRCGGLFTEPTNDPHTNPKVRYHLSGVATQSDIAYILEPHTSSPSQDDDPSRRTRNQWCKIEYLHQNSTYAEVKSEGISQEDVLNAASRDSKEVMLVYATEEALASQRDDLPQALENFIKQDNLVFQQELDQVTTEFDDPARWASQPAAAWDDTQRYLPKSNVQKWAEKWNQGTYNFEKTSVPKEPTNLTTASAGSGSGQESSNGSGQATFTPDTEMADSEMREKEGSSLVGEMMSGGVAVVDTAESNEDSPMVDVSLKRDDHEQDGDESKKQVEFIEHAGS